MLTPFSGCGRILSEQSVSRRGVATPRFSGRRSRESRRRSASCRLLARRIRKPLGLSERIGPEQRLNLLGTMVLSLAAVVCIRLYGLQGTEGQRWTKIASRQHDSTIKVQGARGTVLDSSGRTLAVSVRGLSIGAHPNDVKDPKRAAEVLAPLIGETKNSILLKLKSEAPFVWLARGLSEDVAPALRSANVEGVATVPEFRRYYPQGPLGGPILGRINTDGEGLSGVELSFNKVLSAPSVRHAVRRDAKGRLLPALFSEREQDYGEMLRDLPKLFRAAERSTPDQENGLRREGGSIELTIDSLLQEIFEAELDQGRKDAEARRTFGVLMDAESGELLAVAQSKGFDPNSSENISPEALRNSVLQDSFEPGSTIKPLISALALENGAARVDETLDCEDGSYTVGSATIRDVHPQKLLSFGDVLVRSSNICMAKLGQRMGKKNLYDGLRSLGIGEITGVELAGESKGILRRLENWAPVDTLTHSFGQGFSMTALQLVQAYSPLANGGLLVRPTLVKGSNRPAARIMTPETARSISDILRGVIEDEHGTGHKAAIRGMQVRGKTGTAQKAREDGRGYDPDRILASFIGFVDGNEIGLNKKLIMLVAVDEPGVKPRWGGTVAAPVFQRAMERIAAHLLTLQASEGLQTASLNADHTSAG